MAQPIRLLHEVDPKRHFQSNTEPFVQGFRIRPYDVMIVVFNREKLPGDKITTTGIHLADNGQGSLREDRYQGKVGLVAKVGSLAFTEADDHRWEDFKPAVGDWVVFNVGDTFSFDLPGGWLVRIVDENYVRAIIDLPDVVW